METKDINLQKFRDFGQLISDTFLFIKQEHKRLTKVILTYVGPFVLITAFAGAWMQSGLFRSMDPEQITDPLGFVQDLGIKYLVYIISLMVSSTLLICAIYGYTFLYAKKGKDGFEPEDVWAIMKEKFFNVLGSFLLMALIFFVGFMLCIAPGVYFITVFILVLSSIFMEDLGVGDAMQRSMYLVKEDFWFSLGIGFVMAIISGLIGYVFLAPSSIMSFMFMLNSLKGEVSQTFSMIYIILYTIGAFFASLVYGLPHITFAMYYFSQVEKKESPNLLGKIEDINKPDEEINQY